MAETLEDLNLPQSVVARIIKESLPDGVNVSKEARLAIARAASVFVLYLTSCANEVATNHNRKTINGPDVIQAVADVELNMFLEPLKQSLEGFKKVKEAKKGAAKKRSSKENANPNNETEGDGVEDEQNTSGQEATKDLEAEVEEDAE